MDYYCPFPDVGLCGDGWRPFVTRYNSADPFVCPEGTELVLGDLEDPHHYNLRITMKGKPKQLVAVNAFAGFYGDTCAAIAGQVAEPWKVKKAQYGLCATWHWGWTAQSAAKKQADIDHWCWVTDESLPTEVILATQIYDLELDPDPSDGDEHAAYEEAYLRGRFELTKAVAEKTGRKWGVVFCDRAKPTGKSLIGRLLWPHEIAVRCKLAKEYGAHAFINWHSCVWWIDFLTAKHTKAAHIAAQADMRIDWECIGGEFIGDDDWTLENRPYLQRLARVDRLRTANLIMKETA